MNLKDWNTGKIINVQFKNGKYFHNGKPIKFIGSTSQDLLVTGKRPTISKEQLNLEQNLYNGLRDDVNEMAKLQGKDEIMSPDSAYSTGKHVVVEQKGNPSDKSKWYDSSTWDNEWKNTTYTFNGLPPSNGYRYFDNGNTYVFRDGKRYLVTNQNPSQTNSWNRTKELDKSIGDTPYYGLYHLITPYINKYDTQGGYEANRAKRTINPDGAISFQNALSQWYNYKNDIPANPKVKEGLPMWYRHLGASRDYENMPANGIRFAGDYNSDGSLRLPEAEYTGIPTSSKDRIRQLIQSGKIRPNPDGTWTPFRDERYTGYTYYPELSQLKNFSIRNNNNSGIYDIFDSYDFDSWAKKLNRKPGQQIEIRDTIWGSNANPKLYNPYQRSK